MELFFVSLLLIATLGYLAQTSGLCLVRGVNEALSGKPLFLLAILCSGSFAWLTISLADWLDLSLMFVSNQFSLFAVLGGFLFGLGAVFNNGCGVSTISKLARGQIAMLMTIIGWLLGWLLLVQFVPAQQVSTFSLASEWHYGGLIVFSLLVSVLLWRLSATDRKTWFMMLAIGVMASMVFLVEPKWAPSSFLKDLSLSFWLEKEALLPSWSRIGLLSAMLVGMGCAALISKSFKLVWFTTREAITHLLAGVLMGLGAAIANGGNDTQLLLALPSFSPAGITTVIFILLCIVVGKKFLVLFKVKAKL